MLPPNVVGKLLRQPFAALRPFKRCGTYRAPKSGRVRFGKTKVGNLEPLHPDTIANERLVRSQGNSQIRTIDSSAGF
jgi:hypothetical protein